jgi:ABC-type glycerol-3-phosphate transport system substrate-binding protein
MRRFRLGLALAALAATVVLALAACGGGDDESSGGGGGGGGGTVSVLSLWGGSEKEAFDKVLAKFTADTGIKTQYETARDFLPVIRSRLAAGNPPNMAIVPRPGIVKELAGDGSLKSLDDLGIDADKINENYSKAWTDLTTFDDETWGIVAKANSKSTVWYDPARLKATPPTTWNGLLALTKKLQSEGKTPWAVGAGDGWPLTDWFESIYLYQSGPEKYQKLFDGDIPFNDQSVKNALAEMFKVLSNQNLPGGVEGALATPFVDSIGQVFGTKPKAELYYEGGFVGGIATGQVNPKLQPGKTIDFFQFPKFNDQIGTPLLGAGDVAVAFDDNDNTSKLMEYLASSEAGSTWVSTGAIVSPNKAVDLSVYPNDLVRKEAEQVQNAEVFRFDGSDLLPGSLGTEWPTVLQGIMKNPSSVNSALDDFQNTASNEFSSQ